LALVTIAAVAITLWLQPASVFIVRANSEVLVLKAAANQSPWFLSEVTISSEADTRVFRHISLQVDEGTLVTMEREGKGPVHVMMERESQGAGQVVAAKAGSAEVATLFGSDGQAIGRLSSGTAISFRPGQALTSDAAGSLPVTGPLQVGSRLGSMSEPTLSLLLDGKVQIVGRSLLTNSAFDAGITELYEGDFIEMQAHGEPAWGVVRVADSTGLRLIAQTTARSVDVARFRSSPAPLVASTLLRLQRDTTVQSLWAAIGFCWAFAKLLARGKEA